MLNFLTRQLATLGNAMPVAAQAFERFGSSDGKALRAPGGHIGGAIGRAGATIPATVDVEQITRLFGEQPALRGVSLAVEPGHVMALLGASGSGKSTLLRIIAGVEHPSSGALRLDNEVIAGEGNFLAPEARGVGLMFQDFALFPHLTLLQNVSFGLQRLPRAQARDAAMAMLERVGLADRADDYPAELSGGQQQRVALARAMAPRPRVLLMDEPFSGLDVHLREKVRDEVLAIVRETGITCIIVTHDPDEALLVADTIAVLDKGELLQFGAARELYEKPAALQVARFFSDVNELPGKVERGVVATPFGDFPLGHCPDGTAATVCIRQQCVQIRTLGSGGSSHSADACERLIAAPRAGQTRITQAAVSSAEAMFGAPAGMATTHATAPGSPSGGLPQHWVAGVGPCACGLKSRNGRVLAVQFLGDSAVLDLAVDGLEKVLKAKVPGGSVVPRGTDVSVSLIPGAVLVFPEQ
ncbi:MAG: ABC transporter ATP-binding protein [Pseudomonadota bacterium]